MRRRGERPQVRSRAGRATHDVAARAPNVEVPAPPLPQSFDRGRSPPFSSVGVSAPAFAAAQPAEDATSAESCGSKRLPSVATRWATRGAIRARASAAKPCCTYLVLQCGRRSPLPAVLERAEVLPDGGVAPPARSEPSVCRISKRPTSSTMTLCMRAPRCHVLGIVKATTPTSPSNELSEGSKRWPRRRSLGGELDT